MKPVRPSGFQTFNSPDPPKLPDILKPVYANSKAQKRHNVMHIITPKKYQAVWGNLERCKLPIFPTWTFFLGEISHGQGIPCEHSSFARLCALIWSDDDGLVHEQDCAMSVFESAWFGKRKVYPAVPRARHARQLLAVRAKSECQQILRHTDDVS